jgi:hypothetical protein
MPAMIIALLLAAAPVSITASTGDLDFSYSWAKEAAVVPALSRRFTVDAARQRSRMLAMSKKEAAWRKKANMEFAGLNFSRSWETAGQSKLLLSLVESTGTYTGGAHPNSGTRALLWDRKRGREIAISALLQPGKSWDGAIRQPFCILLDRERSKRRQEPVERGDWPSQCPELKELTVALADHDRDGRFEHLDITADAYVAGPYAEGPYDISLPLTEGMLAA